MRSWVKYCSPHRCRPQGTSLGRKHHWDGQLFPIHDSDGKSRNNCVIDSPTVLIIEDDPVLLRGLKDNFEAHQYRVQLARDGVEGLTAVLANPAPDLVLLDIMLPKTNGYQI